ncbi:MAG: TfoX/Sxy family DNA transformation protein [Leptospiraceae bacterium]|nr:TfoX/Sxy family DNA transformation protein [Leptospiraceae bacterium]
MRKKDKPKLQKGIFCGGVSEQWLNEIGIYSLEEIQKIGVIEVYLKLKKTNPKVTLNMLWGMQAKLLGISHLELPNEIKEQLKNKLKNY